MFKFHNLRVLLRFLQNKEQNLFVYSMDVISAGIIVSIDQPVIWIWKDKPDRKDYIEASESFGTMKMKLWLALIDHSKKITIEEVHTDTGRLAAYKYEIPLIAEGSVAMNVVEKGWIVDEAIDTAASKMKQDIEDHFMIREGFPIQRT